MAQEHLKEQIEAAVRERNRLLAEAGIDRDLVPEDELPDSHRLMGQLGDEMVSRWVKDFRRCHHLNEIGIQPAFMFLALEPPTAFCLDCFADLSERMAGSEEDDTCDICRNVVDTLIPFAVEKSFLSLCGGVCAACYGPNWESVPNRPNPGRQHRP